jgi:hypothetical protein
VLDEDGNPLVGAESVARFSTFGEGPCPVLETFASAALANLDESRLPFWRKTDERSSMAPRTIPIGADRPRPVLRVLAGLRENLGRRS